MVILTAVAISTITNTGIIDYAIKGTADYSEGQKEEESKLQNIQDTLEQAIGVKKYATLTLIAGEGITEVIGSGEYEIGQEVNIDAVVSSDTTVDTEWTYSPTTGATDPQENDERYHVAHNKEWKEWTKDGETYLEAKSGTVTIPEEGLTLTATTNDITSQDSVEKWNLVYPSYIILYIKQNDDSYKGYYVGMSEVSIEIRLQAKIDNNKIQMRCPDGEYNWNLTFGYKVSNTVEQNVDPNSFENGIMTYDGKIPRYSVAEVGYLNGTEGWVAQ